MPLSLRLLRDFSYYQGALDIVHAVTERIAENPSRDEFAKEFHQLKEHLNDQRVQNISAGLEDLIRRDPVKGMFMLAELMKLAKDNGMDLSGIFDSFNKE
jgi:hypothetical protein